MTNLEDNLFVETKHMPKQSTAPSASASLSVTRARNAECKALKQLGACTAEAKAMVTTNYKHRCVCVHPHILYLHHIGILPFLLTRHGAKTKQPLCKSSNAKRPKLMAPLRGPSFAIAPQ